MNVQKETPRLIWDKNKQGEFINILSSDKFNDKFVDAFENAFILGDEKRYVNNLVESVTNVLREAADALFLVRKTNHCFKNSTPEWMTVECLNLRTEFLICTNEYRARQSDESRLRMVAARSRYAAKVRQCKRNHDAVATSKLQLYFTKDQKSFWKILRPKHRGYYAILDLQDYFKYFKSLNSPGLIQEVGENVNISQYLNAYARGLIKSEYDELNDCISESEVNRAIADLKCGKAAAGDLLINELFKSSSVVLVPKLTCLYNIIFFLHVFLRVGKWEILFLSIKTVILTVFKIIEELLS